MAVADRVDQQQQQHIGYQQQHVEYQQQQGHRLQPCPHLLQPSSDAPPDQNGVAVSSAPDTQGEHHKTWTITLGAEQQPSTRDSSTSSSSSSSRTATKCVK
eukprot:jgi/Chrzof1/3634/Cz13g03070.t1